MSDTTWEWQNTAPAPGPAVPIIRVEADAELYVILLNERFFGLMTHFDQKNKRSYRCKGKACRCVEAQIPTRWKGWFHCYSIHTGKIFFWEFTPTVAESLHRQLPDGDNYRGYRARIKRSKGGKHGRISVELMPRLESQLDKLPQGCDPKPILEKLWGEG